MNAARLSTCLFADLYYTLCSQCIGRLSIGRHHPSLCLCDAGTGQYSLRFAPMAPDGFSVATRLELLLILRDQHKSHVPYRDLNSLSDIHSPHTPPFSLHHVCPKLHPMRPNIHVLPYFDRALQLQRPRAQHPRQPPHTNHVRRL